MRTCFWILIILSLPFSGIAQPVGDCIGAIKLCNDFYSEENASLGNGNIFEYTGQCNLNNEVSSMWYTFTVQQPGMLSFIIDPNNDLDDYDWGLFNITNGGCGSLGINSPEVSCNSWGSFGTNGPTGISSAMGGFGDTNGPGDLNGPPFNGDIFVSTGEIYALVVMNWTESFEGYTIDFSGSSAVLFDDIPPVLFTAEVECGNTGLVVLFDEPIELSSVQLQDFSVTGPNGSIPVISAAAQTPGASSDDHIVLTFNQQLTTPGTYTITVTNNSGQVEDACGNTGAGSITLEVFVPLTYNTIVTPACNGSSGAIEVTNISGGLSPYVFRLNSQVQPDLLAENLVDGTYTVNITDANNCSIVQNIQITDNILAVEIADQDTLSCYNPRETISGLTIAPQQTVSYAWSVTDGMGHIVSGANTVSPVVSSAGEYIVLVTNTSNGCSVTASVDVYYEGVVGIDVSLLVFPNVFTPNDDGANDLWTPFMQDGTEPDIDILFETYDLNVYNRWGGLVYESTAEKHYWNGADVETGTYYYILDYKTSCGAAESGTIKGTIQLLK